MRLPFKYEDYVAGLALVSGFIGFDQDSLNIEYHISDNVLEVYKSDLKEVKVPYQNIESIEYKKGWFSQKLIVHLGTLKNVDKLPFLKENQLIFNLKRMIRPQAKTFEIECNLEISTYKLNSIDKL